MFVKIVFFSIFVVGSSMGQDGKLFYRVLNECTSEGVDAGSCLKLKVVGALERALRAKDFEIFDGVHLIGDETAIRAEAEAEAESATENELEATLPRGAADRDAALNELVVRKFGQFVRTRSIQFKLFEDDEATARGNEEGRKKRRGGTLLLYMLMSLGTMIPLKLGTLALLAGKALIIAKLALALTAIVGLKKLLSGSDGHESSYQVIHAGHGHKKRSVDFDLPYRAYIG